jgi:RimJ/RimL family protein N-acetyltransferase/catechol 2,3-dioxygenase-like lactoylglutathione lyase family enzyme
VLLKTPAPIVEGGLLLRPLVDDDAGALAVLFNDPDCSSLADLPFLGSVRPEDVAQLIASTPADAVAVADANTRELLGAGGLRNVDWRGGLSDFWFALLPDQRGRGLAVPGLRLFAHWADTLGLARLQAYTLLENTRIHRALERAGFSREGVLRSLARETGGRADFALYSILRNEVREVAEPAPATAIPTRRRRRLSLPRRPSVLHASSVDHVRMLVSDITRAKEFYDVALAPLGFRISQTGDPRVVAVGSGRPSVILVEEDARGFHTALAVKSRAIVHEFYDAALAAGAKPVSPPQAQASYHPDYYGAVVSDPDGTRLEAVCYRGG